MAWEVVCIPERPSEGSSASNAKELNVKLTQIAINTRIGFITHARVMRSGSGGAVATSQACPSCRAYTSTSVRAGGVVGGMRSVVSPSTTVCKFG